MSYCNLGRNVKLIEFLISNLIVSDTKQMIENRIRDTSTARIIGLQVKFNQFRNRKTATELSLFNLILNLISFTIKYPSRV